MRLKVLPPEEAKKDIRAKVAAWKREKANEAKRAGLEARKPKPQPKPEQREKPKEEPADLMKEAFASGWQPAPQPAPAPKPLAQEEKDEKLFAAVMGNNARLVGEMLRDGANIEARDENGWTPLMRACMRGNMDFVSDDVVEVLTKNHADVDAKDPTGWTALMFAALHGSLMATNILLACGADPNNTNHDGDTADKLATDARITKAIRMHMKRRRGI